MTAKRAGEAHSARARSSNAASRAEADALARLYDADLAEDPGDDLDLYRALAERTGGPILELAAGTGRIVRPLAAAGYDVTALDLDPAMLARLTAWAPANVMTVLADLTSWRPSRPEYRLAILGLNSLFLLAERHLQQAAFATLFAALLPGGLAVVDVWLPDAADLARYDGRLLVDYIRRDPASGSTLTKTVSAVHDAATATVLLTAIYDEGRPGAPVTRWIRRDALRLVGSGELLDLARGAGFEIDLLAGDYGLEPLAPGATRAILLARRP